MHSAVFVWVDFSALLQLKEVDFTTFCFGKFFLARVFLKEHKSKGRKPVSSGAFAYSGPVGKLFHCVPIYMIGI